MDTIATGAATTAGTGAAATEEGATAGIVGTTITGGTVGGRCGEECVHGGLPSRVVLCLFLSRCVLLLGILEGKERRKKKFVMIAYTPITNEATCLKLTYFSCT